MVWVGVGSAVLGAGANVYAGNKAAKAAGKAGDAQLTASREANELQREMYGNNLRSQQPYLQSGALGQQALAGALGLAPTYDEGAGDEYGPGGTALNQAGSQFRGQLNKTFEPSDIYTDPSYQFRLDQGRKQLESSAAARGGLLTGQGLKDITNYGQGAASQEYQAAFDRFNINQTNLYNRLSGLANTGQNAANAMGGVGTNVANQIGANTIGGAQRASDYYTTGTTAGIQGVLGGVNALGQGVQSYQWGQMNNQLPQNYNAYAGVPSASGALSGTGRSDPGGGFAFKYQ
jgi:hypothetical protein